MISKTNEVRSLMRNTDPDGRPLEDPTADPFRARWYEIAAGGDAQEIRRAMDTLLDKVESLEEALRARVAAGSAVRR